MKNEPLLKIEDLTISFPENGQQNLVVDHISFSLEEGEILGIVGESGSGKTMSALAIMNLLPKESVILDGSICFLDREIIGAPAEELRKLKGTRMAMIFQEPMTSFNPLLTIGVQVEEMLKLHEKCPAKEYRERTLAALLEAGLEEVDTVYDQYPHQLSGGMRQRAMIAMAMIAGPKLLIADEPTTALDVTIQDKIMRLLKKINQTHNTSIILVSHDLGVIKSICNRTLVMKDGKIVESGKARELFLHPQTEYTKELVAAAPATWMKQQEIASAGEKAILQENIVRKQITKENAPLEKDTEEKTHEKYSSAEYSAEDSTEDSTEGSFLLRSKTDDSISLRSKTEESTNSDNGSEKNTPGEIILEVEDLNVFYTSSTGGFFKGKGRKQIVKNASLMISRGESLGIVGESGCGKTTLAKAIAGLIKDTQGLVSIVPATDREGRQVNSRPQMVFQDPYGSLNPVKKVKWILEEPLRIRGNISKAERKKMVLEVIRQVGLSDIHLSRFVSQLSGGQRQRVAIAAALILNPELIILDEPVSSLDVTVQAQILKLLKDLQQKYQLSYLFISHDLNVIYQVCDRVCVMYQGEIVETRDTKELFINPQHEYSKVLLEASLPD